MNTNEVCVAVTGGHLIAKATSDTAFPGVSVEFVSATTGTVSELALLEQCDQQLVLRSWLNMRKEEPVSPYGSYDPKLFSEIAYGIYLANKPENALSLTDFVSEMFCDQEQMYNLLPQKLYAEYHGLIVNDPCIKLK